jgi:hypothetical protein
MIYKMLKKELFQIGQAYYSISVPEIFSKFQAVSQSYCLIS